MSTLIWTKATAPEERTVLTQPLTVTGSLPVSAVRCGRGGFGCGCGATAWTLLVPSLMIILLLGIVRFYKKHNVGSSQMQNVRCKVLRDFYWISALAMGTLPRLVSYSWYATFQYRA